jgi:hypothetical protein
LDRRVIALMSRGRRLSGAGCTFAWAAVVAACRVRCRIRPGSAVAESDASAVD